MERGGAGVLELTRDTLGLSGTGPLLAIPAAKQALRVAARRLLISLPVLPCRSCFPTPAPALPTFDELYRQIEKLREGITGQI